MTHTPLYTLSIACLLLCAAACGTQSESSESPDAGPTVVDVPEIVLRTRGGEQVGTSLGLLSGGGGPTELNGLPARVTVVHRGDTLAFDVTDGDLVPSEACDSECTALLLIDEVACELGANAGVSMITENVPWTVDLEPGHYVLWLASGRRATGSLADAEIFVGFGLLVDDDAEREARSIDYAAGDACPAPPALRALFNMVPDASCFFDPANDSSSLSMGQYDLAQSGAARAGCENPYALHLLVESHLPATPDSGASDPNILQLHSAQVEIKTDGGSTILFEASDPALPNPFLVTTHNSLFPSTGEAPSRGIASVEVIPVDYARQLASFVDTSIVAEVTLYGTTTGDADVESSPFPYSIELCDGCLTYCASDLAEQGLERGDLTESACSDNLGHDGRVCIDSGC